MDEAKLHYDILVAAYRYHALECYDTPDIQLLEKYTVEEVLKGVESLIKDGYLEMGSISRSAWPTHKGMMYIAQHKDSEKK